MVKFMISRSNRNSVDIVGKHLQGGTIYDTKIENIPEDVVYENNFEIIGDSPKTTTTKTTKKKVGKK